MKKMQAEWTPDCLGKQDYDGPIISLLTRYWPRGGGFATLTNGRWEENDARPEIKPSARAVIVLKSTEEDTEDIAVADFEAETEEEVKAAVEAWAEEKWRQIADAVRAARKEGE